MEIRNLKIIIADSSLVANLKLRIQLEKLGCSVIATIDNSFRLLYLIEKLNPDIIIIDTEILNASAENYLKHSEIPALFTTCFGENELLFRLTEYKNTIGYFVKPLDQFSLYSCLKFVSRHYLNQQINNPLPKSK